MVRNSNPNFIEAKRNLTGWYDASISIEKYKMYKYLYNPVVMKHILLRDIEYEENMKDTAKDSVRMQPGFCKYIFKAVDDNMQHEYILKIRNQLYKRVMAFYKNIDLNKEHVQIEQTKKEFENVLKLFTEDDALRDIVLGSTRAISEDSDRKITPGESLTQAIKGQGNSNEEEFSELMKPGEEISVDEEDEPLSEFTYKENKAAKDATNLFCYEMAIFVDLVNSIVLCPYANKSLAIKALSDVLEPLIYTKQVPELDKSPISDKLTSIALNKDKWTKEIKNDTIEVKSWNLNPNIPFDKLLYAHNKSETALSQLSKTINNDPDTKARLEIVADYDPSVYCNFS